MKFIVSSNELSLHLQTISRVINSKNTLPILDCFLFDIHDDTLSVTVSDGETVVTTAVPLVEKDTDGRIAITARTLLEALREGAEQPLTFNVNDETMEIKVEYQNGEYTMIGQNADMFPLTPAMSETSTKVDIDSAVLLTGINRTFFAIADDELRPVMNGICFDITTENLTMVASDGHKLVRNRNYATHGSDNASFILPKKPAGLLKNILSKDLGTVSLEFDDKNAAFVAGDYKLVCRLIEGRYPNYNSVIPQNNPYKVTIDRQTLIGALRRVSIFSSQASSLIKVKLQENKVVLSAQDIDFSTSAQETVDCQYDGVQLSIGFKATFFIDILSNISSDEIVIELADPSRAGVIVPTTQEENEDLLMLLMPMMLND